MNCRSPSKTPGALRVSADRRSPALRPYTSRNPCTGSVKFGLAIGTSFGLAAAADADIPPRRRWCQAGRADADRLDTPHPRLLIGPTTRGECAPRARTDVSPYEVATA